MSIVLALLAVGLPVAVVTVLLRRRGRPEDADGAMFALRRGVNHLALVAAAFATAGGATSLLAAALPSGARIAGPGPEELAFGLALIVVAAPVWALLWRIVHRRLVHDEAERASTAWALHVAAVATIPLIVGVVSLVQVGTWALGAGPGGTGEVATALVWGGLWVAQVVVLQRSRLTPSGPLGRLGTLAGSTVGLVTLALGAVGVLSYGLGQVYRAVVGPALVEGASTDALTRSGVLLVLGGLVWWWHWLRDADAGPRDGPWHLHVLVTGVLGGLATAAASVAVVLRTALVWAVGAQAAVQPAAHFATVPRAVAAAVVGLWVWRYHSVVLDAVAARSEPQRAADHIEAGIGLVSATGGATFALVAAIEALTPAPFAAAGADGARSAATALALLLVGVPLWAVTWQRLQARARGGDESELVSPTRRAYLLVVVSVAGLTTAASAVSLLFVVFRDLLDAGLDSTVVRDMRIAVALVVSAGGVAAYHWVVQRADRAAAPATPPRRHVLLISADGRTIASAVAQRTGARVKTLRRLDIDGDVTTIDADAIATAIGDSPHPHVLVTVDGDGAVHVIPYRP
jgi:uncharacterized membrane protein YhaH (DUF805 family)